jgi:hypothetical protein
MREQLKAAVASGAIAVKKSTVPKTGSALATQTLPKWAVMARKTLLSSRADAEALAHMKGNRDPEFAVRLNALLGAVQRIQERCVQEGRGVSLEAAAKRETAKREGIEPVPNSGKSSKLLTARRAAETAINYINTIDEGLSSRDIQPEHFSEISASLRGHLHALHAALGDLGSKPKSNTAARDMLDADSMNHYRHASIKLDRQAKAKPEKPAFTVNLPVLAIFDGVVPVQKLLDSGLPVENMGGYPVFLHQTILCVRTNLLASMNMDKEVYIESVLRQVNSRSGSSDKFELVTEVGMANPKHEVYMYWLMPARQLSETNKAANNPLREWGLPFKD